MVANQSKLVSEAKHLGQLYEGLRKVVTPLKFNKEIGRSKNQISWDEDLRSSFATAGLTFFLHPNSSLQAPKEKALELLLLRQISDYLEPLREKRKQLRKTKTEAEKRALDPEDQRFEQHLEKQKLQMLNEAKANQKLAEKRGVRAEAVYLNPISKLPKADAFLNPDANIEIKLDDGEYVFEPEDQYMRLKPHYVSLILTASITEVDGALWKHISVGDVSSLYSLINTNFLNIDREDVVADLNKRLNNFKKKENELFLTFKARFESLLAEMAEVNLEIDKDVLKSSLKLS